MKKICLILAAAMLMCMAAACGSKEEISQTDTLYAVFYTEETKEYPVTYTGEKKTAVGLADALSELTGIDFTITAKETNDGLIVDWAAASALVAGSDGSEQKEEFFFFDYDSMCWFMMDSLWRTLTENLGIENVYYTMDGGKELVLEKMSPAREFPSDVPYMGSGFYAAHDDVRGDDGTTDMKAPYQGFWMYSNGWILEINDDKWNLYEDDGVTLIANGPMGYDEEAAYMMNEDGSSGGGKVSFDENHNLIDSGDILTYLGASANDVPKG